jgi:rhodanese-related sulfurtransferase
MTTENAAGVPIEISCPAVHEKQKAGDAFLFLDCREPGEYATAKINGTVLVPMSELADRVAELEPHKNDLVVVHCHHGGRSLRVAMWLRKQGFPHACSMAGGIDEWSQHIDTSIPRY